MKISTKGIYALEAIVDLAIHSKQDVESIKNIALRRSISENYLEQLLGMLRRKGIVESTRGALGGYRIKEDLHKIYVGDVIEGVEGALVPEEYREEMDKEHSVQEATEEIHFFWIDLMRQILSVTDDVTIQDIVDYYEQYAKAGNLDYQI